MKCKFKLVELNGVPTRIGCWGERNEKSKKFDEIIVLIPGLGGVVEVYKTYAEHLHRSTNLPVWIIGHGGHEDVKDVDPGPLKGKEDYFTLRAVLQQKIEFFTKTVDPATRIHLVGHSLGGWMSVQLLKIPEIDKKIVSVTLLYPALENIVKTSRGVLWDKYLRYMLWLLHFIIFTFDCLALSIQKCILSKILYFQFKVSPYHLEEFTQILRPSTFEKFAHMLYDMLEVVKHFDIDILRINKSRVNVIYVEDDSWVPGSVFRGYKKCIPDLKMIAVPYMHEFPLFAAVELAKITEKIVMGYLQ